MENENNQPIGKALSAFIISIIAVAFSSSVVFSVPGIVLGIISLSFANSASAVTIRPYYVFRRIAKPMSIASIAFGAFMCLIATIFIIVYIIRGGKPQ